MAALVASLEAELKLMEASNESLLRDNRGVYNVLRAKDKELDEASVRVEAAAASELHCKVG